MIKTINVKDRAIDKLRESDCTCQHYLKPGEPTLTTGGLGNRVFA
jgi:hypothetical protein